MTPTIYDRYQGELPFLFKVLSVQKALSIQAHPDKKLAERLFKEQPQVYKDDNHKPEMAIALTPFEGLCSFKSLASIRSALQDFPELVTVCNHSAEQLGSFILRNETNTATHLKALFHALMTAPADLVETQLNALVTRLGSSSARPMSDDLSSLVLRLHRQYPGDVGVFCAFLLNYIRLEPGEAMFLAANEPHAYLSGDCVECMATSDNVVRAGLTPKRKDVETLVSMLTYRSLASPKEAIERGEVLGKGVRLYKAPVPEFNVLCILAEPGLDTTVEAVQGPSIALVVQGEGQLSAGTLIQTVKAGCVYFIAAGTAVKWKATSTGPLQVFQGYCDRIE